MRTYRFTAKSELPPKEKDHATQMEELVFELQAFANDFGSAASLLDYCYQTEITQPHSELSNRSHWWKFVAGRDGAMSLFHFLRTLESIRGSMNLIPSLMADINHALLRRAEKQFLKAFPVCLKMRVAVAHLGEIGNTIEKRKRNTFTKGVAPGRFALIQRDVGIKIMQSFDGFSFIMTFEGEILTYDLDMASYQRLLGIVRDCLDAFSRCGNLI